MPSLKFNWTAESKMKIDMLESAVGNINVPLHKFAYYLYQNAEREGYMPEDTGDLKHNKLISVTGKNQVTITQLMIYSQRRYYENYLNPNQREWFQNYYDTHKQKMDDFLLNQIIKELEDLGILGE